MNFKNLSKTMGLRGRLDHHHAYVEDFTISQMADGSKVVKFKKNPTKTGHRGVRNATRHSPQQMWSTDSGEQDSREIWSVVLPTSMTSMETKQELQQLHLQRTQCGQNCWKTKKAKNYHWLWLSLVWLILSVRVHSLRAHVTLGTSMPTKRM